MTLANSNTTKINIQFKIADEKKRTCLQPNKRQTTTASTKRDYRLYSNYQNAKYYRKTLFFKVFIL